MFKKNKPRTKGRGGLITAVDVGTTKVACAIAHVDEMGKIQIRGYGLQESHGLKAGVVVDMDAVENSLVHAVHAAEQMAKETVKEIYVNISGNHLRSHNLNINVNIAGHAVDDADMKRLLTQARMLKDPQSQKVIHTLPTIYSIDGTRGIQDPRGMFGEKLGVNVHVVTGAVGPLFNLIHCVERSHLDIEAIVVSPFASGLATLVEDERTLGVTLIDMGGGTTSVAIFNEGQLLFTDSIPVGGAHVTSDIARGLSTTLAHAERIKTLYGSATASVSDDRDMIVVPQLGDGRGGGTQQISKTTLINIIRPRIEETFDLIKQRLHKSGVDHLVGRRLVLTGGASQLAGIREVAALMLDKNVRLGKPYHISNPDLAEDAAFSTCAGLIAYAHYGDREIPQTKSASPRVVPKAFLGRLQKFLKS